MELQFKKEYVSCLAPALRDVQNIEQTQELRLTDGMPDIGRILCTWGQVILRGKEWRRDAITLSGGMMVWVMYLPENGTQPQYLDTWVPFQFLWDLPANTPEGTIRVECLTRFVDARSVSARKIMLRCGVAALAETYVPYEVATYGTDNAAEDVQLLQLTYPVTLPKEAGEKTFLIDEDLPFPGSMPKPEKLISYRVTPALTDQKVMANKVVFKGNGKLHLVYESEEGQLHSWDTELPFSQFAELSQTHSGEANVDLLLGTTSLELDMDDEGQLHLKCGVVAQYLVNDLTLVKVVEDAYSIRREMDVQKEEFSVPAILESRWEQVSVDQNLDVKADLVIDAQFMPDFPSQRRMEGKLHLELPGSFQLLFYGEDGTPQTAYARWQDSVDIPTHSNSHLTAIPAEPPEIQAVPGSGNVHLRADLPLRLISTCDQEFSAVSGLEMGQEKEPAENRPSLILRRADNTRLWDMAKANGSTVEAIKQANRLEEEPAEGQILLIPVS